MADTDWAAVRVPVMMVKVIDLLLQQDIMKKNGVFSRSDFATRVIAEWFSNFEKEFGMFVPKDVMKNLEGYGTLRQIG